MNSVRKIRNIKGEEGKVNRRGEWETRREKVGKIQRKVKSESFWKSKKYNENKKFRKGKDEKEETKNADVTEDRKQILKGGGVRREKKNKGLNSK